MSGFSDFIKDIFMMAPDRGLVGLTGIKPIKKTKKTIVKATAKKSDTKLSDLMRKSYKKLEV